MILTVGEVCILHTRKYIPQRNIECTRCHQVLSITEFPSSVLKNKTDPLCRKCKKERHKAFVKRWKKERAARTDLPKDKECKGCHRFKPIAEFNFSVNYKDGLHSHCKSCVNKESKKMKQRWKRERNRLNHQKKSSALDVTVSLPFHIFVKT